MNLQQFIEHFHWLRPIWLFALPLLLVFAYRLLRSRKDALAHSQLLAPHLSDYLIIRARRARYLNPLNGLLLSACLAIVALAGPSWRQQSSPLSEDEAVLIIALDVSGSMQQADVQPSRLERAKQKIQDLLELRAGARSGLIVFSGSAHSVIPPTNDLDLIWHFLNAVQPEMMPKRGKASSDIIPVADKMLREVILRHSDIPATVLLLTDGVNDTAYRALSQYFENSQHQLLVWGIGSSDLDHATGQNVGYTPLDARALKTLASAADGHYQALSIDKRDVRRINWRIENHLLFVEDEARPWQDMGYYLLWPILILNVLWFRRGWSLSRLAAVSEKTQPGVATISLLSIVLGVGVGVGVGFSDDAAAQSGAEPGAQSKTELAEPESSLKQSFLDLWFSREQQARYYFEQGDYATAAKFSQHPMYRGVALYLAENFDAAADTFASVDSDEGLFNRANSLAHGRHYVLAVQAYTQLLNRTPNYRGAAKNRAIVQALIDANNRMSESQQAEVGELEQELGEQAQSADGAEQLSWQERQQQTFSAEQILTDERIQQQWMKQVQQDPARFLAVKFQMQANSRNTETSEAGNE